MCAAPAVPTLTKIVTEGLKKAASNINQSDITRASDEWIEEIKNDIWEICKKPKSLQTTSVLVTNSGQSRYPYPTDYSSDLSLSIMTGGEYGTAQAGTSGSITVATGSSLTESGIIGKDVLIYAGTAKNSMSQVTGYDTSTLIASVTPNFIDAPDSTSKYMFIDQYTQLAQKPIWDLDSGERSSNRATPTHFFPIGDSDNGEFILYPAPYRDSDIPWGMQLRYYANLMKVDLDSTLMSTLYQRWRNLFVQGVYAKKLDQMGDSQVKIETQRYYSRLQALIMRESYGMDLSNLQMTVSDY